MLENKHFSAKHKTGDSIKLRTDSGVIHDSCEANIGSLQGNCRSISAILCDGALDGEKWHVINRVHTQTGTFYDHIAVKGAVSEAQALRLCQKYFNPFENAVTKSIVAVGDNGLKLFLDSENTPTNTNFFLPQDAQILDSMVTLKPVEWSDNKLSSHGGTMSHLMLDMAMYDLSGELLEKVTPKDVVSMLVDDQCQFMMYDAMILKYSQLDLAVKKIAEALKQSDTEEFFVKEVTPIEPFKRQGVVNVGAIFEMSDTQTITVLFNNPDTTPAKLTSTDVITSWKWILNKRDVTAVLQPRAVDAKKYPMIANRMYQLLAKNHARFKRAQAVRNKDEALLAELIGQLEADQLESRMLEQQIAEIQAKIDEIGVKKQQQSALESGNEKPLDGGVAVLEDGENITKSNAVAKAREIADSYINYEYQPPLSLDEAAKLNSDEISNLYQSELKRLDAMYEDTIAKIKKIKFDFSFKKDWSTFDEIASDVYRHNKYVGTANKAMVLFFQSVSNQVKPQKNNQTHGFYEVKASIDSGNIKQFKVVKNNVGKSSFIVIHKNGNVIYSSFGQDMNELKSNMVSYLDRNGLSLSDLVFVSGEDVLKSNGDALANKHEPTVTRYSIKSTNPRARKPVGSVKLTSREDGMSDVLFVMDGVGGEYVGMIEDVQKWVAMRMQGLGSAAAGEETTFSDVKPRLTLVEGEDLLGVNGAPSQPIEQVQTVPPAEESAVNNADIKMTGSAAQRLPFLASALVSLGEGWVKDGDTAIKNIQFKNGITDVFRLILSDNGRDFIIVDNDNRTAAVQYDDFKTENGVNNAAININNQINEQVAYLNELYSGGAKSHQGESAVNENEKFLNDVIAGAVDLGADATGERLEQIGEDLDPALEDLFEQAAEVYAQFAINNAQSA